MNYFMNFIEVLLTQAKLTRPSYNKKKHFTRTCGNISSYNETNLFIFGVKRLFALHKCGNDLTGHRNGDGLLCCQSVWRARRPARAQRPSLFNVGIR